jgi:hypothetical protein
MHRPQNDDLSGLKYEHIVQMLEIIILLLLIIALAVF